MATNYGPAAVLGTGNTVVSYIDGGASRGELLSQWSNDGVIVVSAVS